MARIPFPAPEDQSEEIRQTLAKYGGLNVTRMMSHQPGLMQAYAKMGVQILRYGTLDPVLRERIILRVGQLCRCEYERHQHLSVARAIGMTPDQIAASERDDRAAMTEAERTALTIVDQIHGEGAASAQAIADAERLFGPDQIVEICVVTGYYIMTAGYLRSLDVECEDTPPLGDRMAAGEQTVISRS
ncbi:carboxymuconolactone decarboxylase family protein [Sphingosinithalassobacter portus]|uniref:carboxymuconolactone decarboxylase family protein n=1 Tax=Stakelama portus TaxID=2676234 RepID=UPI000D6E5257|nr:carboxymuconolactone decarboxylase family protein [Sphingosinithalassobacter portus]